MILEIVGLFLWIGFMLALSIVGFSLTGWREG
jgi:hypothetical protein